MWKVIRNYIPRKETTKPIYSRNIKTLADEFNIFFTSVGVKVSEASAALVAEHNLPTLHRLPFTEITPETHAFHFHPVSCIEIRKIIKSFSSDKAPGLDKVSMSVFFLYPHTDCKLFSANVSFSYSMEGSRDHPTCKRRRSRDCKQ